MSRCRRLYEGIIEELNQNLARFEKLKRVLVVPEEFSAADGTLTHTFKVRRRGIEERYRTLIDEMYARAEAAGSSISRATANGCFPRSIAVQYAS